MNFENIGKLIKELRIKNNMTQKEFAEKYNVTFQAVSKWENGINIPDVSLLKQMSKDFNISLDELYDGKIKSKSKKSKLIVVLIIIIIFISLIIFIICHKRSDSKFNFKTLSSTCSSFTINGNISYNKRQSSIYITNINYCGGDNTLKYKKFNCVLYHKENNEDRVISSYDYDGKAITLEEFLKKVTFVKSDFNNKCNDYNNHSLYLKIEVFLDDNTSTLYKVPLELNKCDK